MSVAPIVHRPFELPDRMTSLPTGPFTFSPAAGVDAEAVLAGSADALYQRLLRDRESEAALLVARTVLAGFLGAVGEPARAGDDAVDADGIAAWVGGERERIAARLATLAGREPEVRRLVCRERAPIGLVAGCWLDDLSNPATQPSVIVNELFRQHFALKGEGEPQRSLHTRRHRLLATEGVHLPDVAAVDFLDKVRNRPLTAWHGALYLALSRLPGTFLPEVVGVHYAFSALALDDLLLGSAPMLAEPELRAALAGYLALTADSPTGPADRRRLLRAVRLVLELESEHAALLTELADWHADLPLDARVAEIVRRHAPFAGRQHRNVRVGGALLAETLGDPELDLARFLTEFRDSHYVTSSAGGGSRFLRALKLGGPMFGVFDEREGAILRQWVTEAHAGDRPAVRIPVNSVGDAAAERWQRAVRTARPADVVFEEPAPLDDRRFLHRLVNIENFAHLLPQARRHAERVFVEAEVLFTHGAAGLHTDASYFDYTPAALLDRVDRIYWEKLVDPYRPLTELPDRDEVVFGQKLVALASLLDGTWSCRTAGVGRYQRPSDGMLFAIYADEMGRGDLRKNHITMIHQVLASMDIHLPHLREVTFVDQDELPDTYGFGLHQLCMSLFPDTFYNEILGYNLCVEMFGLGRVRLQEIQKLRRYGFDTSYEAAHLSIDNFSTGHARQAAEIIVAYLDGVARGVGAAVVQDEWRRIWRGYASFAYFVESALLTEVSRTGTTGVAAADSASDVDLLI